MSIRAEAGRIAYLSGAPRVSTRPEAEDGGPRSHVLGTISGFRQGGWDVNSFIVGDRVPRDWVTPGSYARKQGGIVKKALVDSIRLAMRVRNNRTVQHVIPQNPDFVYERLASMQALGASFQRKGVPWVLETNAVLFKELTLESSTILFYRTARKLELSAYQQCDALVCVSEKLKEMVLSEVNIPESKIIVLPNGVDTEFFRPIAVAQQATADSLSIGMIGTFREWQALDVLLDVAYELRQSGMDIQLTLVGDGPEKQNLMQQAERLGIKEYVSFPGRLPGEQIPEAIAQFDLGYSGYRPTHSGEMYGSPLKLYEYMAMAKPVAVSRNADSDELITDGETGFAFQAGDKESLKAAITRAMNSKSSLESMGEKARKIIEENHSWQKRVETLLERLEPIIGEPGGYKEQYG
jgi:glycosyltransferase involved in cell wall biosynthesis